MNSLKIIFDRDTWQEIFGSIQKNKVRTIITVIGVLWGIFIYIALSGSANGLDNGFEREFENIAMNSMFVWAQSTSMPYDGFKTGRNPQLKTTRRTDFKKQRSRNSIHRSPKCTWRFGGTGSQIVRGTKSGTYNIYGDFPEYTKIATKKIYNNGRFINQSDIDEARKVCVIGERTQKELFEDGEEPVGQFIRIDDIYFQVIGVHKYVQGGGFESDGDVFIPFATFQKLYNTGDNVDWLTIAAFDDVDVVAVEKNVKQTLKRIHRVDPRDERAFGSFNLGEVFNRIMGFARGMTFLSLVVGIATIIASNRYWKHLADFC